MRSVQQLLHMADTDLIVTHELLPLMLSPHSKAASFLMKTSWEFRLRIAWNSRPCTSWRMSRAVNSVASSFLDKSIAGRTRLGLRHREMCPPNS
jgi:hypothetical protein